MATMKDYLGKKLKIYDLEWRSFLWIISFFLIIFLFLAIFRSYVDATFMKRYGAEEIPLMLLINGVLTVVFFWFIGSFFRKAADSTLIAWFMIFCALLTIALFLMVKEGIRMAYPILYQLLNFQDSFFLVYLWNVAGDLFDARQGKRIFPLVMAGQVLGTTLGSIIVAPLAKMAGYDFLLIIVAFGYLVTGMGLLGTASLFVPPMGPREKASAGINKSFGEVISLIKGYPIVRYLIANAFFPNILLPIFVYQFALIAQSAFHSEQALLSFLSIFRGATSLIIFLLMFVMGRFYLHTGLTRASFFHPLNFAAVFGGLALSFNIFIAAYGQFSILLIQRAIAGPINKVIFNLAPERIIKWTRVFVGGTVIKASIIISALMMVILKQYFSAQDLAYLAAVTAMYWLYETYLFNRRFTAGLKQTLTDQSIDYERIKAEQSMVHDIPYMEVQRSLQERKQEDPGCDEKVTANPERALKQLADPKAIIRARAAYSFAGSLDIRAVNGLIERLNDVEIVRRAAIDSLSCYGDQVQPFLAAALINAPLLSKQGILEAMRISARSRIPFPFVGHEMKRMYHNLASLEVLSREPASIGIDMLATHLREDNEETLRLIFQAMRIGLSDTRLIYRSLNTNKAAAAAELLESMLPYELTRYLMPLIENIPADEKIAKGRRLLIFSGENLPATLSWLGGSADPMTRMLTAFVIGDHTPESFYYPTVERLLKDEEESVRQAAAYAMKKIARGNAYMPEVILNMSMIKKTPLFDGMSVRALEAIAYIVKQRFYQAGDVVIKEQDEVFSLYCIINGKLDVYRRHGQPEQKIVRTLLDGEIFGEIPLFTSHPSRETYIVASDFIEVYIIDHEYIRELMNIYPQIGVNMGTYFALQLENAERA